MHRFECIHQTDEIARPARVSALRRVPWSGGGPFPIQQICDPARIRRLESNSNSCSRCEVNRCRIACVPSLKNADRGDDYTQQTSRHPVPRVGLSWPWIEPFELEVFRLRNGTPQPRSHQFGGLHYQQCSSILSARFIRRWATPSPQSQSDQEVTMTSLLVRFWVDDQGQDIAEYAVMLAVILVLVVGTIRLVGSNANTVFSQAASSIQ